jgi:hypothetical protein
LSAEIKDFLQCGTRKNYRARKFLSSFPAVDGVKEIAPNGASRQKLTHDRRGAIRRLELTMLTPSVDVDVSVVGEIFAAERFRP